MVSCRCLLSVLVSVLWMFTTAARADGQGACAKESDTKTWQRASLEGVELEYRTVGAGEPVVLVHAGVFADWFEPLLKEWTFTKAEAAQIKQPVLLVMGGKSHEVSPVWQQRQDLLTVWLRNVEPFVLDGATHMLHVENARGLAERLGAFFSNPPAK